MKRILLFAGVLFCCFCAKAQGGFDYYISNTGSDANQGNTKQLPKKTIGGVAAAIANGAPVIGPLSVGFKSGNVFNETFNPGFPVNAGTYFDNSSNKNFAILNGSDVFDSGWLRTPGTVNLYEQSITLSGFTGYGIGTIGSYSIVSVLEIDRVLEQTAPFTARKVLKFFGSLQVAEATPGSFYQPMTTDVNPVKVYIHTSDGNSPNNHSRYRYEVTVRDRAFNSTYQQGNYFERLWIRGYGAGNGMISAGANSVFNRMIFGPAAGIHHLGLRGATLSNSLFLPAAVNVSGYAVVFYDVEGFGRHNTIKNSIFLDGRFPIYAHNSYGSNFGALELDNVIAFADTAETESFLDLSDTDSALLNNLYVQGHKRVYGYGHAKYFSAKNSTFIDLSSGILFGLENLNATINNCFFRTRGYNEKSNAVVLADSCNLILANSIIRIKNYNNTPGLNAMGGFVIGAGGKNNSVKASGNIFICDVDPAKYVIAGSALDPAEQNAANSDWQNNVYILLRGNKIEWRIVKPASPRAIEQPVNFEGWRERTGFDKRSLYFDLRNDPRGLKAIFVDPDNGDYSLANTFEGMQIRAMRAGMTNPITCFLPKPTYEEAAKIIMNDAVLTANACRKVCVQNNIRVNHQFEGSLLPGKKIKLQWYINDERGIDHYEILRSFGNSDFVNIASFPAGGGMNYNFTDSAVIAGITYRYSLVVVSQLLEKCYSEVRSVKLDEGRTFAIYPNPSAGKIKLLLNSYSGPVKVSVVNVLGITVYSKEHNSQYAIPVEIDLSSRPKGFYWMKIQTDKESSLQRLIIQ